MKKILLTATAVVLSTASFSFAATALNLPAAVTSFKPSANVLINYAGAGQDYVANTKHTAGDRIYSSSNKTSAIWYSVGTAGTALTATGGMQTSGAVDSDYSSWSSQ